MHIRRIVLIMGIIGSIVFWGCAQNTANIEPPKPLIDVPKTNQPPSGIPHVAAEDFFTDGEDIASSPVSGEQLLAECVARMPLEPLKMIGTMTMRKMYGVELKKFRFAVFINWGAAQSMARYDILTTKDEPVETIHAVRHTDGSLLLSRFVGADNTPAETPVLNSPVLGTDLSWLDVSMDYVWWKNPTIVGEEKIKGRTCDILEVEPPTPIPGCAKSRLWVDRKQRVVMQAAQVNEKGKETRKMWVRAVQKIDGRWVVRDLEVETIGSGHRTRLHIDDVFSVEIEEEEEK